MEDKLNPIKIWWGAGAWHGTQLGLLACQPGTQPASQPDNQPGRQESSQLPHSVSQQPSKQSSSPETNQLPAKYTHQPGSQTDNQPANQSVKQLAGHFVREQTHQTANLFILWSDFGFCLRTDLVFRVGIITLMSATVSFPALYTVCKSTGRVYVSLATFKNIILHPFGSEMKYTVQGNKSNFGIYYLTQLVKYSLTLTKLWNPVSHRTSTVRWLTAQTRKFNWSKLSSKCSVLHRKDCKVEIKCKCNLPWASINFLNDVMLCFGKNVWQVQCFCQTLLHFVFFMATAVAQWSIIFQERDFTTLDKLSRPFLQQSWGFMEWSL